MVSIGALWLPILLSAVLVFVASSIIHMAFKYHQTDYWRLPDEEAARAALGKQDLRPGQYVIPYARDMKDLQQPDTMRKFEEGPVAFLTVRARGPVRMGKALTLWFLYSVGISIFVAYLSGRVLPAGTEYLQVFRVAGTAAWLGYGGAVVWAGIWKGVPWASVAKDLFDGLVYALLTAGAFGALWPR